MLSSETRQRISRPYLWAVITLGAAACAYTVTRLQPSGLGMRFVLIALVTLVFGSRVYVKIPRTRGMVSVSDTFIFLTMLLFGGEAAVLLAAADGFFSSVRITKQKTVMGFNAGVSACSTFMTVVALWVGFGDIQQLPLGDQSHYISAVCAMALVSYVVNSGLVAAGVALRSGVPIWQMWRQNFLWTSITYFAGASSAGIIVKLIEAFGLYAFLATAPIVIVVYFTYVTYLKNVEASAKQAELARQHALEVQQHMQALRESEERFRSAFDNATIGMGVVALDGRWLQVNRSLCDIVGYGEGELLESEVRRVTHREDLVALEEQMQRFTAGTISSHQAELRYCHKSGKEVWAHLGMSLVRDGESQPLHLIFQIQDITDRKRAEEQLLHDAFHDALTGLPNRALFMDHVKMAIQRSRRSGDRLFAALFLDLDRFKIINDSLGHMVGDQLLVGIAHRLEACLRPGDTVARLGGDEFTILLEDLASTDDAIDVARRVQEAVTQPFNIGGHEVFTTASIGIALSNTGYERAEDLLRDADTAMYRAKLEGKKRHVVFDKAMHDRAMELLQTETDLRRALTRQEFFLNYQPIVDLETGRVASFEALVRWRHPERGLVMPGDFVPVAEETGLIVPLGLWVLNEACRQMREWQRLGLADEAVTMSVNLSGRQFSQADLIEQIASALRESGLKAANLKLEITESMVMENFDTAIGMLRQLRNLGVGLSIDDFGTGYSSLSYLHRFPIDTLKIDRSFVTQMTDNSENAEIVRTIVTLARSLDMAVVAEGVETADQLRQLGDLGCDYGQGYLFSRPVGAGQAAELLTDGQFSTLTSYREEAENLVAA
ncbi:MAG TPA: EAL domain-containing protein [Pyrinomonadaceae bacterium]|jgi:diguanylate cyclase (GGDEF)-like protein/PAS domain S-box-containing protein